MNAGDLTKDRMTCDNPSVRFIPLPTVTVGFQKRRRPGNQQKNGFRAGIRS